VKCSQNYRYPSLYPIMYRFLYQLNLSYLKYLIYDQLFTLKYKKLHFENQNINRSVNNKRTNSTQSKNNSHS